MSFPTHSMLSAKTTSKDACLGVQSHRTKALLTLKAIRRRKPLLELSPIGV